jgi:hypothetical protein
MKLFSTGRAPAAPGGTLRLDEVETAVRQLTARIESLELRAATLHVDVLDRMEKVSRNLAGREAKREERAATERPPRPWELGKRNGG